MTSPEPRLQRDIAKLAHTLPKTILQTEHPTALIVTSGLPGSGKSYLSRNLAEHLPLVVLNSDALRKALVVNPQYTQKENYRLFVAIQALTKLLLDLNTSVIIDSTNILEVNRKAFTDIAETLNVRCLLIHLTPPEEISRLRLEQRKLQLDHFDHSAAGWKVYERMRSKVEPIRFEHLSISSSSDFHLAVNQIVSWFTSWDSQLQLSIGHIPE